MGQIDNSQNTNDRRNYSMLEKYLDAQFSNLEEKISDLKGQDKEHYNELKSQISYMHDEMTSYHNRFDNHLKEEYPHEKCKENSEKIEQIQETLDNYLKSVSDKEIYNSGLKKGVYLSAKTLKYIFWGTVSAVASLIAFWDKIKGFLSNV